MLRCIYLLLDIKVSVTTKLSRTTKGSSQLLFPHLEQLEWLSGFRYATSFIILNLVSCFVLRVSGFDCHGIGADDLEEQGDGSCLGNADNTQCFRQVGGDSACNKSRTWSTCLHFDAPYWHEAQAIDLGL